MYSWVSPPPPPPSVGDHLLTFSLLPPHARFREQSASIRSVAPYYHASVYGGSIREAPRQQRLKQQRRAEEAALAFGFAIAASIVLVISVSWNVRRPQTQYAGKNLVAEMILSDHIRSLIGTHLLDVPSTGSNIQ